jgi:hypothetical protein
MAFKVGQPLVFVGNELLKKNEIYTVTHSVFCSKCKEQAICVDELKDPDLSICDYGVLVCNCGNPLVRKTNLCWWETIDFRPLDHQFGEDIANQIEEEINEEFLIKVDAL